MENLDNFVLRSYFPRYLTDKWSCESGALASCFLRLLQVLLRAAITVTLTPRSSAGRLDEAEVNEVYDREASTYDLKHHLTTRGMDTIWRRLAGWSVVRKGRGRRERLDVLDLCTGTGLTAYEILKVASSWNVKARIVGLDYNQRMLNLARKRAYSLNGGSCVEFVKGDAMQLSTIFNEKFDVVSQVFGIGGISDPLLVYKGVLEILKPGGNYFLIDMHRPIFEQPGEYPFFFKWMKCPNLEAMTYYESTLPLVLKRLWGWRDPTLDFYLLPLITSEDADGTKWGFDILSFEVESQRWWWGLTIMPVAKIVVEKIMLNQSKFLERKLILSNIMNSPGAVYEC